MIRPQTRNKGTEHLHLKFLTHHHHLYRKLQVFTVSNLLFRQLYADKDDQKRSFNLYLQTRLRKKVKLRYWSIAPFKKSRPSGIDSLTYSYQHMLWQYTYVKRVFLLKPSNSKLYSLLHTRHKISTSNAWKPQVYSHWFCNYKHAMAPSLWVITPIIDTNKAASTACGT